MRGLRILLVLLVVVFSSVVYTAVALSGVALPTLPWTRRLVAAPIRLADPDAYPSLPWAAHHLIPTADLNRYWPRQDITRDNLPGARYLTFEPWNGGFNNRRMSLENAFVLAHLLNRTLVLPPPKQVAQLKGTTGFEDFFDLWDMRGAVPVLTYAEYRRVKPALGITKVQCGRARHKQALRFCHAFADERRDFLGAVNMHDWDSVRGIHAIPNVPPTDDHISLRDLTNFASGRAAYDLMDTQWRQPHLLHFPQVLFGNFYTQFWFRNKTQMRAVNRLVRDHVHFVTPILERASRIRRHLGTYSCVHVRRTDFRRSYPGQFSAAWEIGENTRSHFLPNETIYIASDEKDPEYYRTFEEYYHRVRRFTDVQWLFRNDYTPEYWVGCIEQMLCAWARVFVGTRLSTFSSYVVRLRGYYNMSNVETYFTDTDYGGNPTLERETPYGWSGQWSSAIWGREYPEGWQVD